MSLRRTGDRLGRVVGDGPWICTTPALQVIADSTRGCLLACLATVEQLGARSDADQPACCWVKWEHALSPRETQVLRLIVDGQTNAEIAAHLHLSEWTVHRHVSNILTMFGLPSRTAAAIHAVRSGLV